jgi:hypothetical protein
MFVPSLRLRVSAVEFFPQNHASFTLLSQAFSQGLLKASQAMQKTKQPLQRQPLAIILTKIGSRPVKPFYMTIQATTHGPNVGFSPKPF